MSRLLFSIALVIATLSAQKVDPFGGYGDVYWGYGNAAVSALAKYVKPNLNFVWSTGSHTAQPVIISSIGPDKYTSQLQGMKKNSDMAAVIRQAIDDGVDVIMVIGDGMGFSHLSLPIYYAKATGQKDATAVEEWLSTGKMALSYTNPVDELVTCSAASGTAIANGVKTRNTMLGVDSNGFELESVLEYAQKRGLATGLVTDKHVTDATPAAYYAAAASRSEESDIASQLVKNGAIDVILGGGALMFVPESTKVSAHKAFASLKTGKDKKSKRSDKRDLILEMKQKGYEFVCNDSMLSHVKGGKVFGLFSGGNISAAIDRDDEATGEPTLEAMAKKSLSVLKAKGKGFFVMLESGRIDAEAHKNDAGALLKAMLETDRMLKACLEFRKGREKKTLMIMTADHETGGFGISYSYDSQPDSLNLPSGQTWKSPGNGVPYKNLIIVDKQTRSFEAIVNTSKTAEELIVNLGKYTPFSITQEEAVSIMDYKESEKK
ncbi:MAG: alkaline phosphatase [Fibrobacteres bacterium]|nr:alkaline phosphatase [Fibrobacterota bacterium]